MNNEDKIYNKIQNAANKGETPNFPGMEKVWARVEDKLDASESKSESSKWKKIAAVAAVLVVGVTGYNLYNPNPIENLENNVTFETTNDVLENSEAVALDEAEAVEQYPNVKAEADAILEEQITKAPTVATIEEPKKVQEVTNAVEVLKNKTVKEESDYFVIPSKETDKSTYDDEYTVSEIAVAKQATQERKLEPLIIKDGKVDKKAKMYDLANEEFDSIIHLKEPLYIINGVEYSEQELFGPKPTSPYAPLQKQDIISTTVYQGQDATKLYGKKGEKGVVIITTKDGKPKK